MRSALSLLSCVLLFAWGNVLQAQVTVYNIEALSNWSSCTVCAGAFGNGTPAEYGMAEHQTSPSMNGNSTRFWIGAGAPYSDALWWKQLGAKPSAHHFIYDLHFYLTNPNAPQALEFDVNQSVNGLKYIFSTECDVAYGFTWRVWDTKNWRWINTGVACVKPTPYQWHHLRFEFERTTDNKEHYISMEYDGQKHYWNIYASPRVQSASELNVAFQEDGNYLQTPFSVWLNKVNLTYW